MTNERGICGTAMTPTRHLRAGLKGLAGAIAMVVCFGLGTAVDANEKIRAEIDCLALTMYFEARGESDLGKLAVGHVVMNRVSDQQFPDEICAVVRQGGEKVLHRCQFSWWCDGRSDRPRERAAWRRSTALAYKLYWGYSDDPTSGALWYHADYVRPAWKESYAQGPKIGQHIFYRKHPQPKASLQWASRRGGDF